MRISIGVAAAVALTLLFGTTSADAGKRKRPAKPYAPPSAAMAVDLHSGRVLHSSNATAPRYPASITKVMTLYLLFDALRDGKVTPDTELPVSEFAASQMPTKLGLKPGDTIKIKDAVGALVTKSANDVAVVVAEALAGSHEEFARRMTQKARQIGMTSTTFRNASGLPHPEQRTTAQDLITLGRHILADHPSRSRVFNTRRFFFNGRAYRNHNALLFSYRGLEGMKTGFTSASGFNLIASAKRDDKHVMAVVLGGRSARSRDATMRTILDSSWRRAMTAQAAQRLVAAASAPLPVPRKAVNGADAAPALTTRGGPPPRPLPPADPQAAAAPPEAPQTVSPVQAASADTLRSQSSRAADAMLDRAKFAAAAAAEPKHAPDAHQATGKEPVAVPAQSGLVPERVPALRDPPEAAQPEPQPARVSFHPGRGALYTGLLGTDEPEEHEAAADDIGVPDTRMPDFAAEMLSDGPENTSVHMKAVRATAAPPPGRDDATAIAAPALLQTAALDAPPQPAIIQPALEPAVHRPAPPVYPGPFHIQIGAFADQAAAEARRDKARRVAGASLGGHPFFTMTVEAGEGTLIRARFAGFQERQAKRVCASLKRNAIDCLILRTP